MPDRTPCTYCRKIGFVRRERVIKGGRSIHSFYCGSCNRTWEVVEENVREGEIRNQRRDNEPNRS